jgi:glutathione synthase/RimK-type ligase-like ATP-grasp enzyme
MEVYPMSVSKTSYRLAIATSASFASVHPDDTHLVATLKALGIQTHICIWNDPAVDWSLFDAVLVRTIWDYFQRYAAFLAWLDTLDRLGIPTINNSRLLRWNSDKRYLVELAQHRVPIITTQITHGTGLPDTLRSMAAREVVVKPSVSGGAWHTIRGTVGDSAFEQALASLPLELTYLVQPFVPEIASEGEWSLLYFAGEFSHAVLKRPAAGDYRVQDEHGGRATPAVPDAHIVAAADQALATATALVEAADLAYARVDGVVVNGHFLIMELELIEPLLHLAIKPAAAERFARHVAKRLDTSSSKS